MTGDVTIAMAVMHAPVRETDGNLARMEGIVRSAADRNVEILCFPELCITGYSTRPVIRETALQRDGREVRYVADLAKTFGMAILAGMAERDGNRIFAAHFVASPDGSVGFYRKVHLAPPEKSVFSAGDELPLFHTRGLTFGVELCYDAHFPEMSGVYALNGADVIFMPHASPNGSPDDKFESWLRHLTARAYDNGVYVAACNQKGENGQGLTFPGIALVLSPSGKVTDRLPGDGETMLTTTLRRKELLEVRSHRMRYFLPHRRPDLYDRLLKP